MPIKTTMKTSIHSDTNDKGSTYEKPSLADNAQILEPVWDIAKLFPAQGAWSEADYLSLNTKHLVEYSHGYIEVLPMATEAHQLMVLHLYRALLSFVELHNLGW